MVSLEFFIAIFFLGR